MPILGLPVFATVLMNVEGAPGETKQDLGGVVRAAIEFVGSHPRPEPSAVFAGDTDFAIGSGIHSSP
jgi:hypothetical protein